MPEKTFLQRAIDDGYTRLYDADCIDIEVVVPDREPNDRADLMLFTDNIKVDDPILRRLALYKDGRPKSVAVCSIYVSPGQ